MKKGILKILSFLLLIMTVSGCSFLKSKEKETNYRDIRAKFITTQGEIDFYLYPEAAPLTVANFINLAKRGFYDGLKVHRVVDNFVVQAGDPKGDGTGGPGYTIPDEFANWLDFYQVGILAMANSGPNTGGSQFFFTLYQAEWLNNKHAIFGEYIAEKDFTNIRKLEIGDVIKSVEIIGDEKVFMSMYKDQVDEWNKTLDKKFPKLKKYKIKDKSEYPDQLQKYQAELETSKKLTQEKIEERKKEKEWFVPKLIRNVTGSTATE